MADYEKFNTRVVAEEAERYKIENERHVRAAHVCSCFRAKQV
jgi:hypothetical protein